MTDVRRVIPRQAIEAERAQGNVVAVKHAHGVYAITDAEFAAAFRPAEDLDQLLAAAKAAVECAEVWRDERLGDLRAALRQWDAS